MHIEFKNVRWKNFLSTGNVYTNVDLNKHKTRLIIGSNGSGKSTILDALTFCLYNKPFRKINKPQLINSINKKDCSVEVEFDTGGHKYKVSRGIKPNFFNIERDGKLLDQDAATKDFQNILERNILKLNYKSFCQVVVVGSASFVPFMQLTAASRREVIEDILDIKIFSRMSSLVKDDVTSLKNAITDNVSKRNFQEEKINMFKESQKKLERNTEELIEKHNKKIDEVGTKIKEIQEQVDILVDEVSGSADIEKENADLQKNHREIEKLETSLNVKINNLEKIINFYDNNEDCPTCRQTIEDSFKLKEQSNSRKKSEECKEALKSLSQKNEKVQERISSIASRLKEISRKNSEISEKNNQISFYNNNIKEIVSEVQRLQEDKNVIRNDAKLAELEKEYKDLRSQYSSLKDEAKVLEVAVSLLKDSGIKSSIIKQYIPVVNNLINQYLQSMDFFVKFELDENFAETILSRHRDIFSYESFSEGEKFRIDLALLFTWRKIAKLKNSVSTNILIMDEVFDSSLDSSGTDDFMKLINDTDEMSNILIISHKGDQLHDAFDNVMKFEKMKGFSRVAA